MLFRSRTTSSSSDQRVLAVPTLCGLIVRLAREIFGNLMPTTIVLSDYLLEQFVLLERPSPPSECGIEGMDTVFAAVAVDWESAKTQGTATSGNCDP